MGSDYRRHCSAHKEATLSQLDVSTRNGGLIVKLVKIRSRKPNPHLIGLLGFSWPPLPICSKTSPIHCIRAAGPNKEDIESQSYFGLLIVHFCLSTKTGRRRWFWYRRLRLQWCWYGRISAAPTRRRHGHRTGLVNSYQKCRNLPGCILAPVDSQIARLSWRAQYCEHFVDLPQCLFLPIVNRWRKHVRGPLRSMAMTLYHLFRWEDFADI